MKKIFKRLCTGFLAFATIVTALPTTAVHAESKQYWTQSNERVGIVEKVMNDGSIGSTFNEGHLTVDGEDAYCIDINTDFRNGYKTRADASTRMSADQIADVALSIEYVKQYTASHGGLSSNHAYLLRQLVVWQRLSVHLGWQCDNVRASYDEIPKATQDEVFAGAKAFVKENKGRYECGGYIYSGEGQELGQFWANLNVGNATLQKSSTNTSITDGNGNYSIAGATYGVFSDKDCKEQLIPVNETKLTAAKMIVSLIFSILIYLLLFIITFSVEAILHFQSLSIGLVLGFLKTYLLDGLGIFLAISPIIALVAKMKKGYWLALVFAEIYSFAGLFASMSATLKALYPITAVFNISGYYETVTLNWIYSVFVLLLCGGFSALILRNLNHKKKWRIK